HQAVTAQRLAPGLRAAATAAHPAGPLIEALESADPDRWLIGIQCHPERTESSPPVLERLWAAFVAAARAHRSPPAVRHP
ncbi:MAG: gamma-glutamyl-gamma-aminobutyrate hydrolase family protein, partial [Candidatus Limnocylindria bacterium]